MEYYHLIKSLHIIFVVTWFAGLFYIVRLFIYHAEAKKKTEQEQSVLVPQYQLMQKRLWYIITWPSLVLTWTFGIWLMLITHALDFGWMHLKLAFVTGLTIYHLICHRIFLKQKKNTSGLTSTQLRLWNELATLFLIAIIFIVVYKSSEWYKGVLSFIIVAIALFIAVFMYKKYRKRKE